MYTKKSNKENDYRLTYSNEIDIKPLQGDNFDVAIRYATLYTSVTVIVILIVTQLIGVTLRNGFLVSTALGLGVFVWTLNKGISLTTTTQGLTHNSYESDQQSLQQTASIPQNTRIEIAHTELVHTEQNKWFLDKLDVEIDKLQALAKLLMNGKSFNRETCKEAGISQLKWDNFKAKMLENGYFMPNSTGNKQGYSMTTKGSATFRYLAESPTLLSSGNEND